MSRNYGVGDYGYGAYSGTAIRLASAAVDEQTQLQADSTRIRLARAAVAEQTQLLAYQNRIRLASVLSEAQTELQIAAADVLRFGARIELASQFVIFAVRDREVSLSIDGALQVAADLRLKWDNAPSDDEPWTEQPPGAEAWTPKPSAGGSWTPLNL